jgi:hypothetical protein
MKDETKNKISQKRIGRIHITDGVTSKFVYPEDLDEYPGWKEGRKINMNSAKSKISDYRKGLISVTDGVTSKWINSEELEFWKSKGWILGHCRKNICVQKDNHITKVSRFQLRIFIDMGYKLCIKKNTH